MDKSLGTKKHGNDNVQANVCANNSGQFEAPHIKMWGFEAQRARKFTRTSPRTLPWNFIANASCARESLYREAPRLKPLDPPGWASPNLEAQQRYFSHRSIPVAMVSRSSFVFIFVGCCACIAQDGAEQVSPQ